MKFLLDTCVISELTKPEPSTEVLQWLAAQDEYNLYICAPTIGELQRGIEKLAHGKHQRFLQEWLKNNVIARFAERIIAVDTEIALHWGILQAHAAQLGKSLPIIDSMIAATALFHGMTLVTRNGKDFEASGAKLFNPWS
jgi:toxin FitB